MLTLTVTARDAIQQLIADDETGKDAGLRIAAAPPANTDGASPAMTLAFTPGPEPGDEVVEQDGVHLFLDATASRLLADQTLDARVDDTAEVAFFVAP